MTCLITFQRTHFHILSHLGLNFNIRILKGHKHSVHSILPLASKIHVQLSCHQLKSLNSEVSSEDHLNQMWMNSGYDELEANTSLVMNLWYKTCYMLPKHNVDTGRLQTFLLQKEKAEKKESQIPPHASPKHNGAIFMSSKGSRVILFDFILCLPDPLQWGSCLPNTLGRGSCFWDSIRWQSCLHSFAGRLILLPRLWVDPQLSVVGVLSLWLCQEALSFEIWTEAARPYIALLSTA